MQKSNDFDCSFTVLTERIYVETIREKENRNQKKKKKTDSEYGWSARQLWGPYYAQKLKKFIWTRIEQYQCFRQGQGQDCLVLRNMKR